MQIFRGIYILTRHAILCGSAPDGFTQKKINEMHDFLTSDAGGFWADGHGQVIYDACRDFIPDEKMEEEEDVLERKITSFSFARAGE